MVVGRALDGPMLPNAEMKSAIGGLLQVMASLTHREGLAGKEQIINMDPPYCIRFASTFQPQIGRRDVKDKRDCSNQYSGSLPGSPPFLGVIPESKPPVTMIVVNC